MQLVNKLSEIHLANDAGELQTATNTLGSDLRTLFDVSLQHHQFCRIQAADVAVTQQWRLAAKVVAGWGKGLSSVPGASLQGLETLGITAMAWVCSLKQGELRIVGLGKLSGLARALHTVSSSSNCDYVIAGLVGAVMREDHGQKFAPELAEVIMPRISKIPPSIQGGPERRHADRSFSSCKDRRGD